MFVATTKYLNRFAAGFHSGSVMAEMARTTARATPTLFTAVRISTPSDLHSPAEQYGCPSTSGTGPSRNEGSQGYSPGWPPEEVNKWKSMPQIWQLDDNRGISALTGSARYLDVRHVVR